jgi:hypothetical protein
LEFSWLSFLCWWVMRIHRDVSSSALGLRGSGIDVC